MAAPLVEITGTYQRTLHRAENSDFTIGVLEDGTKVLGSIGEDILQPGMEYQFYGKWDSHPTHGNQFKFFQVILARPATRDGTIAYLTKFCSGIGPRIALKLWDVFGSNAISALRTDPMRVSMECPGLRIDVATDAAKVLTEIAELEATRIDLMGLFKGRGFTGTLVDDCIKKWGIHAPNRIRHDPFRLMVEGFGGCGFARCDRMYQDLGLPLGRLKRQLLCLWYAMKSNSHGHTWFVRAEIAEEAARVIGGAEFEEEKVIRFGIRARWLAQKGELITLREYADQEEQIAARLLDLVTWDRAAGFEPLWPDETSIPGISSHQAEQVAKAIRRPVAILVGGPGTGKTHTAGALIRKTLENVNPWDVAVCAPTGKAAVRITESMRNALRGTGVEIEGTTIHRLLGVGRNGHDGKGWGFVHGPDNPLPVKLVVVDEFSMVDDSLLCSLLRACAPGTHLLFIGDPGQLPPVGHGAPLRDMLASGIPSGELTEIHRHGGRIARVCQDIRNGRPFSPSEAIDEDAGENYFHKECANSSVACHWLRRFVEALPEGCDRMWDLQVLCAVNDNTPVSRTALNKGLQSILNPKGEPALKGFRVGDKSICLSNGFYPKTVLCPDCESSNVRRLSRDEMRQLSGDENSLCCVCGAIWWEDKPEASGCFVANGEVGVLRSAGEKVLVFEFSDPHRIISAAGENLESFALAYAITTHKSQGSQAKYIIFMVDESPKARWGGCRELVMTGISRASKVAITIGQMRILAQDCRKAALPMRRTMLQSLLPQKERTDSNGEGTLELGGADGIEPHHVGAN